MSSSATADTLRAALWRAVAKTLYDRRTAYATRPALMAATERTDSWLSVAGAVQPELDAEALARIVEKLRHAC